MEQLFDQASLIKTLKGGIKKGYWSLKDLDRPPPGWREVVNDCKGNPLFSARLSRCQIQKSC
tara:strand:- start:963 stop:1148 length:186 start_codon:yes stop_codon:yes gene_type:complete